jgi:two-component system invasion response regulator UvrY
MAKEESGPGNANSLTIRETEVINHIRKGLSTKEIALVASISTKTVEVHRYNIFKKLNIRNAAALKEFATSTVFSRNKTT